MPCVGTKATTRLHCDARAQSRPAQLPQPACPSALPQFDRREIPMNKFVATCLESRLCLYDARMQHPSRGFAGRVDKVGRVAASLWW